MLIGYILVVLVIAAAVLTTLRVGHSKENKEGNPEYDQKHGQKWTRLSILYVIAAVVSFVSLILYITL